MKRLAYWFLGFSRPIKATVMVGADILITMLALWVAFSLRLDEWYIPESKIWILFCISPIVAIPIFIKVGLYRAIIRYIGGRVIWAIFQAVTFHALIFTVVVFLFGKDIGLVPRTVPLINWMVLLFFIGSTRFIARWLLIDPYTRLGGRRETDRATKVIIYGAGSAGVQLASALGYGEEFNPVAFIDDDKLLHKQKVNGLRIYSITMPSVARIRRNEIIRLLEPYAVHVRTMPGLSDIAQGKIKFDELQEVDIADLLGRDAVTPDQTLFHANIAGKVVMITGAGGSIGSELCRQIITLQPAKVILFELNEFALYSIDKELNQTLTHQGGGFEVVSILGSVVDEARAQKVCKVFNVQTIYHAAAYKHVPMVEQNPGEAIKNNIFGTLNIAQAAISANVETFVLISTDKAVRPTNTMGATKRFAELMYWVLLVLLYLYLESKSNGVFRLP
jgi:FlaA1/EpsC-like NDP-sugar epimerase